MSSSAIWTFVRPLSAAITARIFCDAKRQNFPLPGDDTNLPAHYVNHDMNHVITGYEPTAPGEIARSGFLVAADACEAALARPQCRRPAGVEPIR